MVNAFLSILLLDLLFVLLLLLALVPLCMLRPAAFAVLKRNFRGYFSNPSGYVFLMLFVFACSVAAFVPHEFFNSNLANLDQLNRWLPLIMLFFIPAITMSIWAEERRQGTDELLLTLPASDFDIVAGKFVAAALVFTASLLFSQLWNFGVMALLSQGELDTGLFFSTYLGYWLVGLAMISIGMVASFLTSNLTIGFILGVLFISPLVATASADTIIPSGTIARTIYNWSMAAHLENFGRGMISLASTVYFLMLVFLGIYLSMVLIGRRHWSGGRDGHSMLGHYILRIFAVLFIVLSGTILLSNNDILRADTSEGRVSSLSPDTKRLMRDLESKYPIVIQAFISAEVPEQYTQTKLDLQNKLKEFAALPKSGGAEIEVQIFDDLETFSEEANVAEERFGITPQPVRSRTRGAIRDEEILMGVAFTCGLEKVVIPFFDYGMPVEYELVRSITTVAQEKRRKLGVVRTDAQMMGGFSFAGGQPQQIPRQAIIDELEKQYEVSEVDLTEPLPEGEYDVLLVVQPSSLGPPQLANLVEAVRNGQPAAILEDPRPFFMSAPGTGDPKQAPGGMFGGGQPQPKGDIQQLWRVLGLDIPGKTGAARMGPPMYEPDLVWQEYNPYPKLQIHGIPDTWVFASNDSKVRPTDKDCIASDDIITSGLTEIFFPFPGSVRPARDSKFDFTELVSTNEVSGRITAEKFVEASRSQSRMQMRAAQGVPTGKQIIAARIREDAPDDADEDADEEGSADESASDTGEEGAAKSADGKRPLHVIYIADIDLLISTFLRIRARPDDDEEINWRFENVTFLLNVIDSLAGDDRYIPIRKRKPRHVTLKLVEQQVQKAREQEFEQQAEFQQEYTKAREEALQERDDAVAQFQKAVDEATDRAQLQANMQTLATQTQLLQRRYDIKMDRLEKDRDQKIDRIRRDIDLEILEIQNRYKTWAVLIPPILPALLGLIVWGRRSLREREGISRSRKR